MSAWTTHYVCACVVRKVTKPACDVMWIELNWMKPKWAMWALESFSYTYARIIFDRFEDWNRENERKSIVLIWFVAVCLCFHAKLFLINSHNSTRKRRKKNGTWYLKGREHKNWKYFLLFFIFAFVFFFIVCEAFYCFVETDLKLIWMMICCCECFRLITFWSIATDSCVGLCLFCDLFVCSFDVLN